MRCQVVVAVGGDLEAALALGADAMQLHELLHPLLAHPDATCKQLFPRTWPAVATVRFSLDDLDMHQQRVVAQVAPLSRAGKAYKVLVVPGHAGLKHPALH